MPLRIAFISWSARIADIYLKQLAVDNADQVKRYERQRGRILLRDGTEIVSVHHLMRLEGHRFDQIIVADDWRMNILLKRWDELAELEYRCMASIIPEEFRYQFYFTDEEAQE